MAQSHTEMEAEQTDDVVRDVQNHDRDRMAYRFAITVYEAEDTPGEFVAVEPNGRKEAVGASPPEAVANLATHFIPDDEAEDGEEGSR